MAPLSKLGQRIKEQILVADQAALHLTKEQCPSGGDGQVLWIGILER